MHTVILGAGYSGSHIAGVIGRSSSVCGTRRSEAGLAELEQAGIRGCLLDGEINARFADELKRVTHLVVSVAPSRQAPLYDPMLSLMSTMTRYQLPALRWIGYLSTIGVYGDHEGQWVDEDSACGSVQVRSILRREAEIAWQAFASVLGVSLAVFRLSGIYGPGKNAVLDALRGRRQMIIKPGQVFNRIHVSDLATVVSKAATIDYQGIVNVTDDLPAPPQDVIRYAHKLVGKAEPAGLDFHTASMSDMARSFYSENKRVSNKRSKTELGVSYAFPTYRHGLKSLYEAQVKSSRND